MRVDENRRLAWIVLVACVVVSLFAFGGGALGRERRKALNVFNEGVDSTLLTRHSIDAYLDASAESVGIMANEVKMRVGGGELADQALENASVIGDDKKGIGARYAAYDALKGQVESMYNEMYSAVSESDFRDFKLAYDDFWGKADMIGRDEYHGVAKAYNNMVSDFPSGVIATVLMMGKLDTFGG